MTKIEKTFSGVQTIVGDVWVADFTEATKTLDAAHRKGVVIQDREFNDIASFHLQNPAGIALLAVNFEKNKGFFPQGVKDCECMLRPKEVGKGWLLLCELKYCKFENICINANTAYKQLLDTWRLLDGKRLYDRKHCKIFLNISVPEHSYSIAPPFMGFMGNQDEQLTFLKKHKLHLWGVNNIVSVNSGILQRVPSGLSSRFA